jgi:hypothetical protein
MKPLIKVDRVRSEQEAIELENLGVQLICTTIDPIYVFDDNRKISLEKLRDIGKVLNQSKLCCELNIHNYSIDLLRQINCKYIQISSHKMIELELRQALEREGIGIIYSDLNISYDHDPSWIMIPFEGEETATLNASYYNIELLADVNDSWNFFSNECPNYPDELQVTDVEELASEYPILIGLDYSVKNIEEIINSFSNIKGISFRIGEYLPKNCIHRIDYSELIKILILLKTRIVA